MKIAVLALGSNLGDRLQNLRSACASISAQCAILAISGVYQTPPAFYENQPDFYNCAIAVKTELSPEELLKLCKTIEAQMGRTTPFRNAPRPIDLDIIFYEDERINTDILKIPHIDWQNRDFVITPLLDLRDNNIFDTISFEFVEKILKEKHRTFEKIANL